MVSPLVVDRLQLIHVDHDDARRLAGDTRQRLFPGAAVRELRQWVDPGVTADEVELALEAVELQRRPQEGLGGFCEADANLAAEMGEAAWSRPRVHEDEHAEHR